MPRATTILAGIVRIPVTIMNGIVLCKSSNARTDLVRVQTKHERSAVSHLAAQPRYVDSCFCTSRTFQVSSFLLHKHYTSRIQQHLTLHYLSFFMRADFYRTSGT